MEPVITGFLLTIQPATIALIIGGVIIGVLVGALPGLSSPIAIALLIPLTIGFDVVSTVAMMSALYCAGTYGGSITAILINTPGAPPACATALDGYPMAKRGEAARALGLATFASAFGGIVSLAVFLVGTPLLADIALSFTPPEYFALALFALSTLATISGSSAARNLIAGGFGVLISTVGIHMTTGVERFTFGFHTLVEGINFVPVLIGLFAVSELLNQSQVVDVAVQRLRGNVMRLPSLADLKETWKCAMRSIGIGTFVGILPAEGATVAAIMGYNEAKRWSKRADEFGTGVPEGIVGPETANNAATGGNMVPTLALGIPGSTSTALILAALVMHGLRPGPHLMQETPEFLYAIFWAMLVANLAFLVIGTVGAKVFSLVTLIPRTFLWPAVFVFSVIGAYAAASSITDVWVMLISGLFGYFMLRNGFTPAPLVMGIILGKILEETFSQAMIIYDNNIFAMAQRPIVLIFLVMTLLTLASPLFPTIRKHFADRRRQPQQAGE